MNNIKDIRKIVDLADRNHEHGILPTDLLDDIQQSWSKLGEYFQNDPTFNKYNLIESISNKKGVNDMKVGLSIIESKLNNKMIAQVQNMVKGQTMKAAYRTYNMIKNLKETYDVIQKSEQYRKSIHLQLALNNSKAYIDKAEENYLMAIDEMKKIEITNEAYIEPLKLEKITIKLEKSQFECEKANQTVVTILSGIQQQMESLLSRRSDYINNILTSVLDLAVTAVEFATTPTNILSKTVKTLFATKFGLETFNVIGHSVGFYWTAEEIVQLEQNQNVFKELNAKIEDLFEKIAYGLEKIEKMKYYNKPEHEP
ncbi:unnamed protein product [Adineta ricciae]|uniref:Uncharacterized protein n=1 Tax=Adineta ricciae TaxID=249248 RepID=A0A814WB56_ADIRI|nr:unnamed protein product [Adineta ricciae]